MHTRKQENDCSGFKYDHEGAYHWKFTYPKSIRKSNPRRHAFYDVPLDIVSKKLAVPLSKVMGVDIGCGDGVLLYKVSTRGGRILGIDLSLTGLRFAGEEIKKRSGVAPLVVNASCYSLPLPDDVFDYVVSIELIEHLAFPENFVQESVRVLRPGGVFVCTTPRRASTDASLSDPYHVREYTPRGLSELLSKRLEDAQVLGLLPAWLDRIYQIDKSGTQRWLMHRVARSCIKFLGFFWNPFRHMVSKHTDGRTDCAALIGVGRKPKAH